MIAGARVLGLGVDLVENAQVARALGDFGRLYARKVLSSYEMAAWDQSASSLAGAIASKEAAYKAVSSVTGTCGWHDIEVLPYEPLPVVDHDLEMLAALVNQTSPCVEPQLNLVARLGQVGRDIAVFVSCCSGTDFTTAVATSRYKQ